MERSPYTAVYRTQTRWKGSIIHTCDDVVVVKVSILLQQGVEHFHCSGSHVTVFGGVDDIPTSMHDSERTQAG